MLTMAVIGVFFGLIALLTVTLFLCVVHPLWAIVQLYKDAELERKKRTLWIVAIGAAGPFASLCYGLFVSKSKHMWQASAMAVVVVLMLGISFTYVPQEYKELVAATFHRSVASQP